MTLQIAPFLQAVVVNNGSDLHIKVGGPPKIRISGTLVPLDVEPITPQGAESLILETMSDDVREHFLLTWCVAHLAPPTRCCRACRRNGPCFKSA